MHMCVNLVLLTWILHCIFVDLRVGFLVIVGAPDLGRERNAARISFTEDY